MRSILLGVTFLFFSNLLIAQNHGRFWYFGENAGLDFSTSPPTVLNDGQLNTIESCSAISDDLGNLLFYTDGTSVWNKNHIVMTNGQGLSGSSSSAQQLIVRNRTTTNEFLIFTVNGNTGLSYSVVDMTLDNGLGDVDVSRKNISMNQSAQEKVTAYINPLVTVNWIVTFNNGIYFSYPLINSSIDITNPTVSALTATSVLTDERGMLKISPDGSKIANTSVGDINGAFLTDFDPITGAISNPIRLTSSTAFNRFYGIEFSPDSRLLYVNSNTENSSNACGITNQREIFQYEINGSSNWNQNPYFLGGSTGSPSSRGSLQLAPNGKIYFARNCQPWLGVIENPTQIGTFANYVDDAIPLANGTRSREGLPNVAVQVYANTFNTVNGIATLDLGSDGCSISDPLFSNSQFNVSSLNFNFNFLSGNTGSYFVNMPNGIFTVTPIPENPTYWNFSPANVVVDFPTQASPFTQDFCVTANGSIEDLEVIVVPLEQARPGFDTDYKVVVKNKGNVTTSGMVTLDFEEDFMNLLSSIPIAVTPATNQLSWSVSNLQPFQMEEFLFTMTMNTPTQTTNPLNDGDVLTFTGVVIGTGTDAMPADNTMVFDQTVVNSYDPNDKTCLEGKTIDPADVGEYVHYMIRFENTGTASAVNIVVKDEIDLSQFDITTLIPLGGSHDYYTRIREGNVVEFIHENINLDFNDATNDGYVLFKIKTLNTLVAGDTFDNTADIFFDFNAPIVTNTETVSIMSTASVGEATDSSISIYPNPANSFIHATANNAIESISITDMNGRMITATQYTGAANEQRLEIGELSSGIYFVTIKSNVGQKIEKLVVE
ncbi:T9SS type A sorting domain-containing protein [Nonlabens sp. Asnod2-A12]|uniref:DUF7619 domain-containing protein n=1 Tax=Nonlabens sp. Asnod2-A12 TaxID=3160578 RepID=UPI00386FB8F3